VLVSLYIFLACKLAKDILGSKLMNLQYGGSGYLPDRWVIFAFIHPCPTLRLDRMLSTFGTIYIANVQIIYTPKRGSSDYSNIVAFLFYGFLLVFKSEYLHAVMESVCYTCINFVVCQISK
jgi:hypothetical protein